MVFPDSFQGQGLGRYLGKGLAPWIQKDFYCLVRITQSFQYLDVGSMLLFRFLEPDNILKGKGCYVQFRKPNTKPDPNLLSSVVELVDENGKYEVYHQYPIDEIKNSSLSHINIDSIKTGVSSDTTGSPKNPPANLKKSS